MAEVGAENTSNNGPTGTTYFGSYLRDGSVAIRNREPCEHLETACALHVAEGDRPRHRGVLVQAAKAKAGGYASFRNLRTIIYLIVRKLDLQPTHPR